MAAAGVPPLVSIIIPAYNAEAWIARTVAFALGQTHPRVEVIVADDGSTDATRDVLARQRDLRLRVLTQPNRGPCAAYNAALQEAQGDYMQYLDGDDFLDPEKVEVQLRRLYDEPEGRVATGA